MGLRKLLTSHLFDQSRLAYSRMPLLVLQQYRNLPILMVAAALAFVLHQVRCF